MELLDIYDDNGKLTGKTIIRGDKSIILGEHEHIAIAVIFIENEEGKFLMQKTSSQKGEKYSSTGGHVNSGETPLEAIKREVLEELGIDISKYDIKELGYLLYDTPIRYLYYLKKNIDINSIKVQLSEVDFVEYMSFDEIKDLIKNKNIIESHGIMFNKVIEITRNTNNES